MNSFLSTIILIIISINCYYCLQCWSGSKGVVNGSSSSNFKVITCDDGMQYCFSSYSDDHSDVTASCQTMNTEQRLIDVCKTNCVNHTDIHVTVCCCQTDLCNLQPVDEPTTEKPEKKDDNNQEDRKNETIAL